MKQSSQWPRPSAPFIHRANGRAEDAAGHGTPPVTSQRPVAGSSAGAGGIVGEIFELSLFGGGDEHARLGIARKAGPMLGEPKAGTLVDFGCERGICGSKRRHSFTETRRVEGVDGERSMAALRATDAAGEEVPGAAGGTGERGVDNLHELGIAKGHQGKHRLPHRQMLYGREAKRPTPKREERV